MERPAARVYRGDTVESIHRASVAVVDSAGHLLASHGNPDLVTFVRSSIKHVQALPLLESGAVDHFGLSEKEIAIACSSHNGELVHTQLVEGLLVKAGLTAVALQCGRHPPYDSATAERVGPGYTSLHHNCSGKHAGMLLACVRNGWDTETYLRPSHPLQRRIQRLVAEEAGVAANQVRVGTDGCSAPNFAIPLRSAARVFARLMDAEAIAGDRGRILARSRNAMMSHPYVVAGSKRTDTVFMEANPGHLWIKAGGEACYGVGLPERRIGLAIKIEDGSSRAMPAVLLSVLEGLDALGPAARRKLRTIVREPLRNAAGRDVGRIEAEVPLTRARNTPAARGRGRNSCGTARRTVGT